MALGIAFDIGAYTCKAALLRGETAEPNGILFGENILRSVAYVDKDNKIIVGQKALNKANAEPRRVFFNVKRSILKGDRELPGIPGVTYIDLYVAMIKEVVDRCNKQLKKTGDTIEHVVLTVPSFPEERDTIIAEMKRAAESIEVSNGKKLSVDLLIEPAGVAIHNMNAISREDGDGQQNGEYAHIVYDLGHSTLDVALVSMQNDQNYSNVLHYFRPDDETFCAYFDECIAKEIEEAMIAEGVRITDRTRVHINAAAAELKHTLSDLEEHTVAIPHSNGDETHFTLTRARFEELIIGYLRDSASLVTDALEVAASKGIRVNEILLAGGGSSIPLVERCIREVAGDIPVRRSQQPVDAVSFGASRYCLSHNLRQKSKLAYGLQIPVKKGSIQRQVQIMAPQDSNLPFQSQQLTGAQFQCNPDGIFRTTLYAYEDATVGKVLSADDCRQVRHMTFEAAPNQSLSFFMEIDEEHCVKVICQTDDKQRYVMTSFDPADAVSRKE
ncbi:MAG: Hsp70 family protein [Clostridia bacterium]|nr:Hsp70 family protein [Clostridia bacterium]